MSKVTQRIMRAIAIDRFGGIETLKLHTLPLPDIGPGEVLLRVHTAGIGEWDPFEREGGYAQMQGTMPAFPYVLGSEASGTNRLNRLIMAGPFDVHIAQTFPLEQVAEAHRALEEHYLGKLALRIE